MKGGTRSAAAIDASSSSRKLPPKMPWQRSAPSGIKSSPSDADDLLALGLTVLYALLLLRVLFALGRLLWKVRSAQTADARASSDRGVTAVYSQSKGAGKTAPSSGGPVAANGRPATPIAASSAMLPGATQIADARNAWAPLSWSDIRLRIGPNYKRNKKKGPTAAPLLPCVGVSVLQAEQKVFGDGITDAACLPPEVAAAAAEPTPPASIPGSSRAVAPPPLPRYLVVTVCMPKYTHGAADGPNLRFSFVLSVPSRLRTDPDPQAKLLCAFLDGSGNGHTDESGDFYDRFKVIVRCREVGVPVGVFLRKMIDWFNGKPMLWRFFGIWGE